MPTDTVSFQLSHLRVTCRRMVEIASEVHSHWLPIEVISGVFALLTAGKTLVIDAPTIIIAGH